MHRPFSILLIGTQMTTGGAQKGLLDQALCFHARGCKVEAAFIYDKDGLHETWQQRAPFPIHDLQIHAPNANLIQRSIQFMGGIFRLWKFMRREKFDIVETFTHDSNLIGLPIAWLAGIPVRIATHRGLDERFPRWRLKLHTLMINMGIADIFVAVSDGVGRQAQWEGVRPGKVVVIRNGVTPLDVASVDAREVRKTLHLKEADLFLLAVGRLAHQKGFDILIEAVPALIEKHPHLTVNICGGGILMADLQSQISNLGLSDHVKLLGNWSNVAPLLAIADIFVLSSRFEGLSRAMLEAMAAGVPVVATRVQGVEEVITDGVHGLVVAPEDPAELSRALIHMVGHPEMRRQMGIAAQKHIMSSYTTDVMFTKIFELMTNLMDHKKNYKKLDA
jgi:glycosyltransferase involved in cell wall biosynthesis